MKLKTISKAIAGLALAAGVAGSANAFTITVGSYKMTMDSYDAGTTYGKLSPSGSCGSSAATALDIADCDSLLKSTPNVGTTLGSDSWGIFSVSSITNTTTNTTEFSRGTAAGQDGFLIGTFGGAIDYKVTVSGASQQAYSTGGNIKFYKSATTDYDPSYGPSTHTDVQIFANLAGANPVWLEATFEPAADFFEQNSGYQNQFNGGSLTGSGSGYLSYIGGTALTQFNTDTLATLLFPGLGIADSIFTTTVKPITSPSDLGFGRGWLVKNSADNEGYAIPEPGSMALVGLGLMGLAGLRRRKQQA